MLGAWFNPKTKKYESPSKSVIYRVREKADPAAMETVLKRWSMRRLNIGSALAADGKRLRGANRNGDGHFETATLVAHDTGLPVASHGFHDESGERAAFAVNWHARESHIQRSFRTHCGTEGQLGGAAAGPARSSRRKSTLLAVPSLLDEKEFLQQMRAGPTLSLIPPLGWTPLYAFPQFEPIMIAVRYTYDETGSPNFLSSLTQVVVSSVITTASSLETLDGSVEPWPDSGSVQRRS